MTFGIGRCFAESTIGPFFAFIKIFMSYAHIGVKGAELAYS